MSAQWLPVTVSLARDSAGDVGGVMSCGDLQPCQVRRWHKAADGVVKFEVRDDTAWRLFLERLMAGVEA